MFDGHFQELSSGDPSLVLSSFLRQAFQCLTYFDLFLLWQSTNIATWKDALYSMTCDAVDVLRAGKNGEISYSCGPTCRHLGRWTIHKLRQMGRYKPSQIGLIYYCVSIPQYTTLSKEVGKQSSELRMKLIQWRVVCYFTAHHNEKCETILNEWRWWESWHHITMRSVRLYSMNGGGVRVDITSQWEVWDYTQWMVVCELTLWLQIAV